MARGEPHTFEYRFVKKDGEIAWVRDVVSVDMDEGRPVKLRGFMIDITEQKQIEAQLERSNQELEQFAYVVSHDLQAPLRTTISFLQLLEKGCKDVLSEECIEYLEFALEGGRRMREMIRALLDLSRLTTRARPLTLTSAEKVLGGALAALENEISSCGAVVTHDDELPTVLADEAQLIQVFQNLLANALKFRKQGETARVHVGAERVEDAWRFSVTDEGIGIPAQDHDRIFEVFQRLHMEEEYPGVGIGLALCKRVIERHGGRIWVESEVGEGSTFYFTLSARSS
jgi:light-regulated signal transduction histidine kinase (bacteriophytochrome)